MNRQFLCSILMVVLFTTVFTSCDKKEDETSDVKKITVSLLERDDYAIFEKTVILYEDENYLIKTPLYYFLSDINDFFVTSGYEEQFSTLEKIISDGKENDLLYAASYFDKYRIDYVVALFLENGHCYFYDKKNNTNIKQVVVEYWGGSSAPLAGSGGRSFYIYDNVLFMEITDWVS